MTVNNTFYSIENFDSLIFSLLTRQKIIIVGLGKIPDEFYKFIQQISPEELKNFLTYQPNATSLNSNNVILGVEMSEETMKLLDKAQGKYTLGDLWSTALEAGGVWIYNRTGAAFPGQHVIHRVGHIHPVAAIH